MKRKQIDLRERRHELHLTLEEVGRKAGISPAMVRAVEVEALAGTVLTRMKLCDALKIPRTCLVSKAEVNELQEFVQEKVRAK